MRNSLPIFPKGKLIFGTRLTPVEIVICGKHYRYRCICNCGKETIVDGSALNSGRTKSCGCYKVEVVRKRATTHGLSKYPEFFAAHNAFRRCTDKKYGEYKNYGGRGIKCQFESVEVMTKWLLKKMPKPKDKKLFLDRKDNDGHYAPDNLKWSTPAESARNRRGVRIITIGKKTQTLKEWADELGLSAPGLSHRMKTVPEELWRHRGKITSGVLAQFKYGQIKA